jgi:acyl-CoA reductase-like NAD-dependent aldehyde dehydrogenase
MDTGDRDSTEVGSMVTPAQAEIVERHVNDAVDKGARILAGGHRRADTAFFEPTILVDVDHTMTCMRDETFGPTLPIMKVADEEEALRLANDSEYGLSSSLFTRDPDRADRLSRRIEAGSVAINNALIATFQLPLPMGGWKQSGIGSRFGGAHGVLKYCRKQSVVAERFPLSSEPNWYPVTPTKGRLMSRAVRLLKARDWRRRLGLSARGSSDM